MDEVKKDLKKCNREIEKFHTNKSELLSIIIQRAVSHTKL